MSKFFSDFYVIQNNKKIYFLKIPIVLNEKVKIYVVGGLNLICAYMMLEIFSTISNRKSIVQSNCPNIIY